jgi:hypothetical protein
MFHSSPVVAAVIALAFSGAAAAQPALTAAAPAFRMLSQAAFVTPDSALDASTARAVARVASVRATFPPAATAELEDQLRRLDAARRARNRAGVALASAEVYRILVEVGGPNATKIPPEVRLLDYARLRYQADLQAGPTRWDDARNAAAFARSRWTEIAPRVASGALVLQVDQAIDNMDIAAGDRDPVQADRAVGDLSDVVQQLEAYFIAL